MQVARLVPVSDEANGVTAYVRSLLAKQAPGSVFNYYRLIDVQWRPTEKLDILPAGQRLPAPSSGFTPPDTVNGANRIVANMTMETFQQTTDSCLDCHANHAQIAYPGLLKGSGRGGLRRVAGKPAGNGPPAFASDYSFIFMNETRR